MERALEEVLAADGVVSRTYAVLARARYVVLACMVAGVLYGCYQTYRERAIYRSTSQILLRPTGATNLALVYTGSVHAAHLDIGTEAQIMRSDTTLFRVAQTLNLANDPRFASYARAGYRWDADQPQVRAALIEQLRGGLSVSYQNSDTGDEEQEGVTLARSHKASPQDSSAKILQVSFVGTDRTLSTAIVRACIAAYKERSFEMQRESMMRVATQLNESMAGLKTQVEAEQRDLLTLQQGNGLVQQGAGPGGRKVAGQSERLGPEATQYLALSEAANANRAAIRTQTAEKNILGAGTSEGLGSGDLQARLSLNELRASVDVAEVQEARLLATLGPQNPAVKAARADVAVLRGELGARHDRFRGQLEQRLRLSEMQSIGIANELRVDRKRIDAQQSASAAATTMQMQLDRDSELYFVLVNNVRTAALEAGTVPFTFDVLEEAQPPLGALPKNYQRAAFKYGIVGLSVGLLCALLLVSLPEGGLSSEQLAQRLGMPTLGRLPWASAPDADRAYALALEGLREQLGLASGTRPARLIAVTAAAPGQGATTVAVGLAKAMASVSARVMLIEANPRRPAVARQFGMDGRVGLTNVLSGHVALAKAVKPVAGAPGLDVLVLGPVPPASLDLLRSDAMRMLLLQAAAQYGHVILDLPPVDLAPENMQPDAEAAPHLLGSMDLVLLVVRQGRWRTGRLLQSGLLRTRAVLRASGVPLAGLVLVEAGGLKERWLRRGSKPQ